MGVLLTKRDTFLTKPECMQLLHLAGMSFTSQQRVQPLPLPAILKPRFLWTGKQVHMHKHSHSTLGCMGTWLHGHVVAWAMCTCTRGACACACAWCMCFQLTMLLVERERGHLAPAPSHNPLPLACMHSFTRGATPLCECMRAGHLAPAPPPTLAGKASLDACTHQDPSIRLGLEAWPRTPRRCGCDCCGAPRGASLRRSG